MMVVSYNKMSISSNGTVNKLVVIRVSGDDIELEKRRNEQRIGVVRDNIQYQCGKSSCRLTFKDFGIFCQYLCGDTELVAPVKQRKPQLVIAAAARDTLNQRIGIKDETVHDRLLLGMKILVAHGIKPLLVQNAFVPKAIGFCIKPGLEVSGEHHLNLTRISLAAIKREKLQQMLLGRV